MQQPTVAITRNNQQPLVAMKHHNLLERTESALITLKALFIHRKWR